MNEAIIEVYSDMYKEEVSNLIVAIQKDEFGIAISLDMQPDLKEIPGFYQINNGNFWIARINRKVIGTISLLDIGNRQGALRKMFVDEAYRGKIFGIGQKLLTTLLDWATQKNFTDIFLGTTEKFVSAQRFYEKNGFMQIEKELLPREFPIMQVDVKFYRYAVAT